jgi:hypothetical protein
VNPVAHRVSDSLDATVCRRGMPVSKRIDYADPITSYDHVAIVPGRYKRSRVTG